MKERVVQNAVLAALVFLTGRLGIALTPTQISALYPPAGVALAALLLFGPRLWPGILAGAFAGTLERGIDPGAAMIVALTVTGRSLVCAFLINRFAGGREVFDSVRNIFRFLLIVGGSAPVFTALGVSGLCLISLPWSIWAGLWQFWSLSDFVGALVVAPLIVIWSQKEIPGFGFAQRIEAAFLAVLLLLIGALAFGHDRSGQPLEYLVIPAMLWVALRFQQHGAAFAVTLVAGLLTFATARRAGPFSSGEPHHELLLLQAYLCTTSAMALMVAAVISERRRAEQRLSLQYEIGRALSHANDLEQASRQALEKIGEGLGWEMGLYWEVAGETLILRCARIRSQAGQWSDLRLDATAESPVKGDGLLGRVWQTGDPGWATDLASQRRVPSAAVSAGMASGAGFAVQLGGSVVGLAGVFGRQARRSAQETLEVGAAAGDLLAQFLDRKQAESALRKSESQLRLVWESSTDGMRLADAQGIIRAVNETYCRMMARPRDALVGQPIGVLQPAHRVEEVMRGWRQRFQGRSFDARTEKELLLCNGKKIHLELANSFLEENPPLLLTVFRDISERKRAESLRQEFSLLGQQLSAAATPMQAARTLAGAAQKLVGWDGCVIDLYSAELNQVINVLTMDTIEGRRIDVPCSNPEGKITARLDRAIHQGAFLLLHDSVANLPEPILPFGDVARRSASLIFVPIRHREKVTGVLSLHSYSLKAYAQGDLDTIQALADHCGGALERIRVAEELRQQQEFLRTVFDMAPSLISVKNRQNRYTFVNCTHARFFGKSVEEVIGQTDAALNVQPEEAARFLQDDQEVLRTGRDKFIWEERCTDSKGQAHWLQTIKRPLLGLDGAPDQVLAISHDITERRRVERRNAVFLKLAQRLQYAVSGSEAARVISEVADELFGWDAFTLNLYTAEETQTKTDPILNIDTIDGKRRELSPSETQVSQGPHWTSSDGQGELILKQEPVSMSSGLTCFGDVTRASASLMFVPIRSRTRVLGVISAQSYRLNAYTREDLSVLQALADYCGAALERIRAENALRESDALKGAIMESALDCIITMNREGKVMEFNSAAQTTFGYSRSQVIGKELADLIFSPPLRERHRRALIEYANTGDLKELGQREEITALRADGSEFPAEIAVTPLHADKGPIFTAYVRDITARKRAEKTTREIPGQILQAQESERMRVARELHDSVNQILSSTKFRLDSIEENDLLASLPSENLVKARELLDRAMHEIWRISRNLRPSELDDLGLAPAIRSLCHEFEDRTGVAMTLRFPPALELAPEVELIVYRIVQEALNNVEKHSEATEVCLQIEREPAWLVLRMHDNGVGFKTSAPGMRRKSGMGLVGMKERAAFVGGAVEIESTSEKGTTIEVRIPMRPA